MPATPTYVLLNQITLAAASSSVTFSNIPQNYGDLVLVITGSASGGAGLRTQLNSDTGSNYAYVYMQGSSGGAVSSSGTNAWIDSYIDSSQCTTIHQFFDYSATDKHKSVVTARSIGGVDTMRLAQRWASTNAINNLYIYFSNASTFAIGTTISLYGVYA